MSKPFSDHAFCRIELSLTMADVREAFTREEIRRAWAWGDGRSFEFHGPNDEYLTLNRADCRWSAASEGWSQILHAREAPDKPCEVAPSEDNGAHDWIDAGNGDGSQRCGHCACLRGTVNR